MPALHQPIRVLHIFGTMNRGGAEMRTLDLMRRIDRSRFQFEFCTLSGNFGVLDDEIRSLGGAVHRLKVGPRFASRFRSLLRRGRFDVVHSHVHHFSGLILRLAAAETVPCRIAHYRSTSDGRGNGPVRRFYRMFMKRQIHRYATDIVAVSEEAMSRSWDAHWYTDPRCRVIYNGIDVNLGEALNSRDTIRQELGLAPDELVCIHVGRATPAKNHPRLIEIFSALSQKASPACLLLVGNIPDAFRNTLEAQARSVNCPGRLAFTGVRSDVPRLLAAADLMIFPSIWEGLPGAILEACACGLPVLASEISSIIEISRYLSYIHTLPLSATNSDWAEKGLSLRRTQVDRAECVAASLHFSTSPFELQTVLKKTIALYQPRICEADEPVRQASEGMASPV